MTQKIRIGRLFSSEIRSDSKAGLCEIGAFVGPWMQSQGLSMKEKQLQKRYRWTVGIDLDAMRGR
jgi:hypothetical protein